MSNKRWNFNEKIDLMKLYANGKSFEDIGTTLNRSPNAIKLRLESIVYDNLVKGKPVSVLTRMLNTNPDTIKQFYYSHKSFKEGRGEKVENVDFSKETMINENIMIQKTMQTGGTFNRQQSISPPQVPITQPTQSMSIIQPQNIDLPIRHTITQTNKIDNLISSKTIDQKIEKLERENHILESILKNYQMKRHLRKLYLDGKLDQNSILFFDKITSNNSNQNVN